MNRTSIIRACYAIAIFLVLFAATNPAAWGQDWQLSNPPVERPVPQYRPIYPLTETPTQPAATVQHSLGQPIIHESIQPLPSQDLNKHFQSLANSDASISTDTPTETPIPPHGHSADQTSNPKSHPHYGLDYSTYRDRNAYPIDPRKPCSPCTRPPSVRAITKHDLPGMLGRPHQDTEPGGCKCGKKSCPKCSQVSVYWPSPLSAKRDQYHPSSAELRYCPSQKKRAVDVFDSLVSFKLVPYQRKDNGYCGPGSDPYGCLGESRQANRVTGVDFRNPSDPAAQPAPFNRLW